jgi:hypothetical protein
MMKRLIALSAIVVLSGHVYTGTANAQVYPRAIGSGENLEIDYGPGPLGNVVGGGAVSVSGAGESMTITHLEPAYAQAPRPGLVPITVGAGDGQDIAWVPAGTDPAAFLVLEADMLSRVGRKTSGRSRA